MQYKIKQNPSRHGFEVLRSHGDLLCYICDRAALKLFGKGCLSSPPKKIAATFATTRSNGAIPVEVKRIYFPRYNTEYYRLSLMKDRGGILQYMMASTANTRRILQKAWPAAKALSANTILKLYLTVERLK